VLAVEWIYLIRANIDNKEERTCVARGRRRVVLLLLLLLLVMVVVVCMRVLETVCQHGGGGLGQDTRNRNAGFGTSLAAQQQRRRASWPA
jgi:hypothetical protein